MLSPVFFSIFVNEFTKLIGNSDIVLRGKQLFPDTNEIVLVLFADDIALIYFKVS